MPVRMEPLGSENMGAQGCHIDSAELLLFRLKAFKVYRVFCVHAHGKANFASLGCDLPPREPNTPCSKGHVPKAPSPKSDQDCPLRAPVRVLLRAPLWVYRPVVISGRYDFCFT